MTLMFVDKSFPVSVKILLFQFKGKLEHFPPPEATLNSLDSVSSPVRRMLSRAHKFFKGCFTSVCPTRWVSKPFCPEAQVQNNQDGFSCTCTNLPSPTHELRVSLCCWWAQDVVQDEIQSFLPCPVCKQPFQYEAFCLFNIQNKTKVFWPPSLSLYDSLILQTICQSLICH